MQARTRARRAAARRRGRGARVRRRRDRRGRRPASRRRRSTACRGADAVLLGAVGGPKWDGGAVRPEAGLIGLRRELDVYANLRPALGDGIDLLIVRELVGGLYYGARGTRDDGTVFDTCEYHPSQVERLARRAFELARARERPAALGRQGERARDLAACGAASSPRSRPTIPTSSCEHGLVDSVAMQIVTDPESFDVLVMENTFGDILSDVAAAVTGGLGLAASASLGDGGPGSSSRCTARRPTSPAPAPPTRPRCCARSRSRSSTGSASRAWRARVEAAVDAALAHDADAGRRRHRDDGRVRRRRAGRPRRGGGRVSDGRRLPGAGRQPQRGRVARCSRPTARPPSRYASFIAVVEAAVAAEVSLGVLPIENSLHGPVARDARPPLRGAALDRLGGDPADRPLPAGEGADPGLRGADAPLEPRRVRPVPRPRARARRPLHPDGDDGRRRARGGRVGRPDRGRDRERRGGGAVRPARDRARRRATTRRSRASSASRRTRASTAAPRWRTALSFVTDHAPGSLYHALGPFHRHDLNLVQLVSRPIPQSTFRYRFDMVLDGHPLDAELQAALVEMREWTREVRIFGSYAATGDH